MIHSVYSTAPDDEAYIFFAIIRFWNVKKECVLTSPLRTGFDMRSILKSSTEGLN